MPKLNMLASAVLVWLPKGERPTIDSFDVRNANPPPVPNPEPWWYLEDAIVHAREVVSDHGKLPWIKTGDTLLELGTNHSSLQRPARHESFRQKMRHGSFKAVTR